MACASKPTLNQNLVRQWGSDLFNEFPGEDPGIAYYKMGSFELIYLAAGHSTNLESPTLQMLRKMFAKFQFQVLLIEPIPFSSGESPQWYIQESKNGITDKTIIEGESGLGAILASERKIPFFAGEPDHLDIYKGLKSDGFSDEDIISFYFARQIPQWIRQKEDAKTLLNKKGPGFLKYYCDRFLISSCPSVDQVKVWYKSKIGKQLDANVSNEDMSPRKDGDLYTHKIATSISKVRDHFTLARIEDLLRKYKKVAVVYGAGHFITLRKSFDAYFGPPHLYKLNDL